MKTLFAFLLLLFVASSLWARERAPVTIESCINANVESIYYMRSLKDEQVKIDSEFLFCLNQIEGVYYQSLFDIPDTLLERRYEVIMKVRASR